MMISIPKDLLSNFTEAVFENTGIDSHLAQQWGELLVWANLRGVDSHGVMRIPRYVELIESKAINPRPRFELTTDAAAVAVIDCDRAPGGRLCLRLPTKQ